MISFLCHKIWIAGNSNGDGTAGDGGEEPASIPVSDDEDGHASIPPSPHEAATASSVEESTFIDDDDGAVPHVQCRYHPDIERIRMRDHGGKWYIGSLSLQNQQALFNLARRISDDISINKAELFAARQRGMESWDGFLLRCLRARQFKVDLAFDMLQSHVAWRCSKGITGLSELSEDEVLRCSAPLARRLAPVWMAGFSRSLVPFIFRQLGHFDAKALLKLTTLDAVVRHHCWEQERLSALVGRKGITTGFLIEQWVSVFDLRYLVQFLVLALKLSAVVL